ncbi:hypothetical protein RYX36_023699 [Vicia faba]
MRIIRSLTDGEIYTVRGWKFSDSEDTISSSVETILEWNDVTSYEYELLEAPKLFDNHVSSQMHYYRDDKNVYYYHDKSFNIYEDMFVSDKKALKSFMP